VLAAKEKMQTLKKAVNAEKNQLLEDAQNQFTQ
jgi:hypothetical protein